MTKENTPRQSGSQDFYLPPGLFIGVMPPDGTQLELSLWLKILSIPPEDEDAFVKQLRKDKIPHIKFCGTMTIDATHIRRVVHCGRGEN